MTRTRLIFVLLFMAVVAGVFAGAGEAWPEEQNRVLNTVRNGIEFFSPPH